MVRALLGLQFRPAQGSTPDEEPYTWQCLHRALEAVGYTTTERQRMLGKAAPDLRPGMTLEEAIKTVLRCRV